jgi:hypothetical protein
VQHEASLVGALSASIICSSSPVPSVATTIAWVSPRVNSAEPWVRGRRRLRDDRADLVGVAAVDAGAGVEDRAADDVGLELP